MLSDINYSVPITLVVVNNYERFEKSNKRFESYFKKVFWSYTKIYTCKQSRL